METYLAIGCMSGTSCDGLDIAACSFTIKDEKWTYKIESSIAIPYPEPLKKRLQKVTALSSVQLALFDLELGDFFGTHIKKFIDESGFNADLIAVHGHTVFHQPEHKMTLQIGNGISIMKICQLPVINNFRLLDVLYGGQGAPLVPIGDHLLFNDYDFCLNLGGISNISLFWNGQRVAFDIGPNNMVVNHLTQQINQPFDPEGTIGSKGRIIPSLLDQLNQLDYYQKPFPKSLGYEWVSREVFPLIDTISYKIEDLLYTFYEHNAHQISNTITQFSHQERFYRVLATGGGAYNTFQLDLIRKKLPKNIRLEPGSPLLIDFKEALVFAFLGVLRKTNRINVLKSVTGAEQDTCSGIIIDP